MNKLYILTAILLVLLFTGVGYNVYDQHKVIRHADEVIQEKEDLNHLVKTHDSLRLVQDSLDILTKVDDLTDSFYRDLNNYNTVLQDIVLADAKLIDQEAYIIEYLQKPDYNPSVAEAMFLKARKLVLQRSKLKGKLKT